MSTRSRDQFSTSFGFVMAAAGSAVGLANIWGFPTLAAQNGGAAFLLVYLIITFLVGFPLLMAEFTLGRYARSNPVGAYQKVEGGTPFVPIGFIGIITVSLVLCFYSIVAGKMLALFVNSIFHIIGSPKVAEWVIGQGIIQNAMFTSLFFLLTLLIILGGVKNGIEKWSSRLMPSLVIILLMLIVYVMTQRGSMDGLKVYLVPDFTKIFEPRLLLDAMGQSFFSLSLAVGGMLVFAGYASKQDNLLKMGLWVTLADLGIAFLAGLLIIPAMYVAQAQGMQILDEQGGLLSGPNLVFQVLPELFSSLGVWGMSVALIFFLLMTLAALTSSISILEVPTSYLIDNWQISRKPAAYGITLILWMLTMFVVANQDYWFQAIITITTKYSQPLLGLAICIFVGWVVKRNILLSELTEGNPEIGDSLFFKVWPFFLRYICPVLILLIFLQSFLI